VKFLFATTEVDKLPVTVLSRCQRFDLKRIPAALLAEHFAGICVKEGVTAEPEALSMIAAAAEGSVRDGLSILDQAIAHADLGGDGKVSADQVRDMLGLADKSAQRRIFAALLAGDGAGLLDLLDQQYALGVDPMALLRGALELTHRITVAQLGKSDEAAISAEERAAIEEWAGGLSAGQLHRLWQLLLKGHDEVKSAPDPLVAARMALLRVMHAADMPDPGTLMRKLDDMAARGVVAVSTGAPGSGGDGAAPVAAAPAAAGGPDRMMQDWSVRADRVDQSGQLRVAQVMRDWIRVIALKPGELIFSVAPGYPADPAPEIRDALLRATGERWQLTRGEGEAQSTLREAAEAEKNAARAAMMNLPLVQATLAAFPDAVQVQDTAEDRDARGGGNKWRNRA